MGHLLARLAGWFEEWVSVHQPTCPAGHLEPGTAWQYRISLSFAALVISRRGASARCSEAYLSGIRQVRIRTLPFAFFPAVTKPISVAASSASRTRCRGRPQAWARSVVVVAAPPALCRHLSTSAIARSRSMAVRLRVANMAISGGSTVTTLRAGHCEAVIHAKGPHTPTRLTPEERRNRRSCQGCRHQARNATPQAGARGDSAVPLC